MIGFNNSIMRDAIYTGSYVLSRDIFHRFTTIVVQIVRWIDQTVMMIIWVMPNYLRY